MSFVLSVSSVRSVVSFFLDLLARQLDERLAQLLRHWSLFAAADHLAIAFVTAITSAAVPVRKHSSAS